ncbi:MAG: hypothetical protein ACI30Q_02865 [Muribaculaceae bacterium]
MAKKVQVSAEQNKHRKFLILLCQAQPIFASFDAKAVALRK